MRLLAIVVLTAVLMFAVSLPAGRTPLVFAASGKTVAEPPAQGVPTVDQVLDRYYEAIGGREALERITSRVATGRVVDDRPDAGPVGVNRFEAYGRPGGQWSYVEHTPEGDFAEGFDGSVYWKLEDGTVSTTDGPDRSKMAFVLDPQGPLHIRDYFRDMNSVSVTDYEGRAVYAIGSDRAMEYYALYFDMRSGLLTNIGYHWYLEDYRVVDGVLMPHRVIAGRKGGSVTHVFDEIVTNTPVSGGRFEPPGGDGGVR
jgi:hypothetical protein